MIRIAAILWCMLSIMACTENKLQYYQIKGYAQGTNYNIIYENIVNKNLQPQIDSILLDFDNSLSNYNKNSFIFKLNNSTAQYIVLQDKSDYFKDVVKKSRKIYFETNGAFDPTVFPLVKLWGFDSDGAVLNTDTLVLDSILNHNIGFEYANFAIVSVLDSNQKIVSEEIDKQPGIKLDFNAIAQGYSVDIIGNYLESLGVNNYLVSIGGETKTKGVNGEGKTWKIGIEKPEKESTGEFEKIILLKNKSIATSGSYRKFYEKDGKKYAHIIDPKTGFPVTHSLLSASVIATDCATADAYATAFMVMGKDSSIAFLNQNPNLDLEVFFIYADDSESGYSTYNSSGFDEVEVKSGV